MNAVQRARLERLNKVYEADRERRGLAPDEETAQEVEETPTDTAQRIGAEIEAAEAEFQADLAKAPVDVRAADLALTIYTAAVAMIVSQPGPNVPAEQLESECLAFADHWLATHG